MVKVAFLSNNEPVWVLDQAVKKGESLSHVPAKSETIKLYVQRAEPITGLYVGVLY